MLRFLPSSFGNVISTVFYVSRPAIYIQTRDTLFLGLARFMTTTTMMMMMMMMMMIMMAEMITLTIVC